MSEFKTYRIVRDGNESSPFDASSPTAALEIFNRTLVGPLASARFKMNEVQVIENGVWVWVNTSHGRGSIPGYWK